MMGPWAIVLVVAIVVVILIATSGRRGRGGESTAGHYDPNAIGGYTLDPATMRYRYDLPTLPRSSVPAVPGNAPPHRRRRRRRRRTDAEGG
jgi:hypothetical protein